MGSVGTGPADRALQLARLSSQAWDLAIVGGGATGLGLALDAVLRGYRVALVEAHDFAQGASSRSTKLLHGGVRYLAQGRLGLVRQALRERAIVLANAPGLCRPLSFVVPVYSGWDRVRYGLGLSAYALLAGARSLGPTQWLDAGETLRALPAVKRAGLRGGIRYWDAQFDDAPLAVALARSAAREGAVVLNHLAARAFAYEDGRVVGVACADAQTGRGHTLRARCVVNAAGAWADAVRALEPAGAGDAFEARLRPSRGSHLVLPSECLASDEALLVPSTRDGRVLFAIPWEGRLLAGTTDVPCDGPQDAPEPSPDEVDFILGELARYLERPPVRADIVSQWSGLRPLVRPQARGMASASISREHDIAIGPSGLVTVTGGKWTTYRVIADDVVRACVRAGLLQARGDCRTADYRLTGGGAGPDLGADGVGAGDAHDMADVVDRTGGDALGPGLTEARVRFAVHQEFAQTVEDVLARRVRLLFTDARAALACAPRVAQVLAAEGIAEPRLAAFQALAAHYLPR
ncbi:glycerol-3-phosphate dehydrogenase/oxidase [Ramlibacter sp. MAHUQ-53]|uniref:glycerol-3-phosphate dehydrogenase/oxidase n=1 Tax=unclassified Ramlibacter TaxID=2617605 RepID=UPI003627DF44